MVKAVLIDGDGIVLKKRDKYFSQRLREDGYDVSEEKIKQFFQEIYPAIRLGKKDLRDELSKQLASWNWTKTVDELLDFWFSYENKIDDEVIEVVQNIRTKGIKVYLASDHSKYRQRDLWENVGLKNYFDNNFFSCDLQTTKDTKEFFNAVLEKLSLAPKEVVFFDDEEENIKAAEKVEIDARLYESVEQLEDLVR